MSKVIIQWWQIRPWVVLYCICIIHHIYYRLGDVFQWCNDIMLPSVSWERSSIYSYDYSHDTVPSACGQLITWYMAIKIPLYININHIISDHFDISCVYWYKHCTVVYVSRHWQVSLLNYNAILALTSSADTCFIFNMAVWLYFAEQQYGSS